MYNVASLLGVQ